MLFATLELLDSGRRRRVFRFLDPSTAIRGHSGCNLECLEVARRGTAEYSARERLTQARVVIDRLLALSSASLRLLVLACVDLRLVALA